MDLLTCGCHSCVHTHHKVELKNLESHAVLSSRPQTLDIPLCLGRRQRHHHWCDIGVVSHSKVQEVVCCASVKFPFY